MQNSLDQCILAIESSCDETSVSVVKIGHTPTKLSTKVKPETPCFTPPPVTVMAHLVESQIMLHQPFGGVVPEVAARDHLAKIHGLVLQALEQADLNLNNLTHLAVTFGPGLIGALMVGVLYAQGMQIATGLPLLAVNHVDAHLAPCFLLNTWSMAEHLKKPVTAEAVAFPALALTVSGGHCLLSLLHSPTDRQIIGRTLDDACGEAFDKVAKLLGLPYPGGPQIERLAEMAHLSEQEMTSSALPYSFPTKLADSSRPFDFSFSGLKTSVLQTIAKLCKEDTQPGQKVSGAHLPADIKAQIAYSFQEAAISQLTGRIENALNHFKETQTPIRQLLIAGGVAANKRFRQKVMGLPVPVQFAPIQLCSDNATMIAIQAHLQPICSQNKNPFSRYDLWKHDK